MIKEAVILTDFVITSPPTLCNKKIRYFR